MLDWLKRTLGGDGLVNSDAVPARVIDALARDFARFKRSGSSLPDLALQYVVDGAGDAPAAIKQANLRHSISWTSADCDRDERQVRWQIYDAWDQLPPELLIRFGNVLSASSAALSHQSRLLLAQKHPWVEALAIDLIGLPVSHFTYQAQHPTPHRLATMSRLESLLEARGEQRSELIASTFRSASQPNNWTPTAQYMRDMPGFGDSLRQYANLVRTGFRAKAFEHRVYALTLLENMDATALAPFAEELVALSLDSSRRVRQLAIPLALRLRGPALEIARREAVENKPEQRALALRLLWESGDETQRQFVAARGDEDTADSVRKTVQQLRSGAEAQASGKNSFEIPEVKADLSVPLSKPSRDALRATLDEIGDIIQQSKKQHEAQGHKWASHWKSLSSREMQMVLSQVADPAPARLDGCHFTIQAGIDAISKALLRWMARDDVRLTHVVRLLISMGHINRVAKEDHRFDYIATQLLREYGRTKADASLLELVALLDACGVPPSSVMREWYGRWGNSFLCSWPAAVVWPMFAKHREMIDMGFNPPSHLANEYWFSKARMFDALDTFPEVPADLVPKLMELALGSGKNDRIGAQRVLSRLPGKEDYIIEALAAGRAETRIAAANWLAQLRHGEAIPHLERARAKEKNDAAAGTLMSALETLGVPVDRFLDRKGLQKDAEKALAKGVPADLSWFSFDGLPEVHWEDNGELVPSASLRWLIVQSCKLKSPEPGGVLRRYCASFRPADRDALGTHVLAAWLREDVKPIPRADAEARARTQAQQVHAAIKKYPQYYDDALKNASEEQLYETYLPGFLRQPVGSAIASKGVLAVVAACGGSEVAPPVQRYLKEYYGTRAAQGRALIQMLAWVDHPTATQLVLSVGSRFRTKSFQEEATRQAELLAERKGWTLDELADRTIPTAGFDENAECVIDYGTRQFVARLSADFDVELHTADGKKISSLPDARKDEEEVKVKELKKQFSAAKKELKGVLQLQRDRLYEGLCTQRQWKAEDWTLYLNRHPIVRRYCQRLVWLAVREGAPATSFRPLDDGTLTDVQDNPVELAPDLRIALAHDSTLPASATAAWIQHLSDYKIEPLFQQFGKDSYRLADPKKEATALEDFKGYVLDAFTLRGRTNKLGYTRGGAEDGGWFYRYEKRFPTLGVTAHVEFSGNGLPEENRKVALVSLWFARGESQPYGGDNRLQLGQVPGVLLSECWNDMRAMAAEGTFQADWEKHVNH